VRNRNLPEFVWKMTGFRAFRVLLLAMRRRGVIANIPILTGKPGKSFCACVDCVIAVAQVSL